MKWRTFFRTLVAALVMAGLTQPAVGWACAVCYGEPDSPMSTGLTWGISVLLGVVGCVLAGIVAFFVHTTRKASTLPVSAPSSDSI